MNGEPVRILLVEDNEAHAELALDALAEHRVLNDTYHVKDGQEALDYLWRKGAYVNPDTSPRPHVILLDLRLPKVDGLDVLKQIKASEELHDIPVVVLTTSETESDLFKAYGYNANSYLVKPVNFEQFVQMLTDLGFYWLSWNKQIRRPNG